MPSKKKARGRQNRAKKEATRTRTLWEQVTAGHCPACFCERMPALPTRIPQVGPAVSFMNYIGGEGIFEWSTPWSDSDVEVDFSRRSLSRFPEVLEDESERSLLIELLLRLIRYAILVNSTIEGTQGENWFHKRQRNEVVICSMINELELRGTYSDEFVIRCRAIKTNNRFTGGNRRDVVKFVAERLPCTCLKELHSAMREKVAKVGTCDCCGEEFPRSQLYICTGCMIAEYCSKKCQRASWSRHKESCGYPEVVSRDLPADYVFKRRYRKGSVTGYQIIETRDV